MPENMIPLYLIARNPYCPDCGGDEYHAPYCEYSN